MTGDSSDSSIYDFCAASLSGEALELSRYRGQVLLLVNTASACGFTPQYEGLEALYRRFKDQGLVVLGFPCNQFGAQEPGNADTIGAFCKQRFGVSFPLSAKIDVNGSATHPLFAYLKQRAPGVLGTEAIKWNFTKFLVGKDGRVYRRYAPATAPQDLVADIEKLLAG